ncbi:MAG: hypothetical protein LBG84_05435 [Treponema sp.]|jgi:hypothetical protein|nr:hypothetical protein [Treponema sp.]
MGTITADQIETDTSFPSFGNSGAGLIKVLPTEVDNYKNKFQGNVGEMNDGRFVAQ